MTDPAPLPVSARAGAARRAAALFVVATAVVAGAWQAGRVVGPLDAGAPLPSHVPVHGSVVDR